MNKNADKCNVCVSLSRIPSVFGADVAHFLRGASRELRCLFSPGDVMVLVPNVASSLRGRGRALGWIQLVEI